MRDYHEHEWAPATVSRVLEKRWRKTEIWKKIQSRFEVSDDSRGVDAVIAFALMINAPLKIIFLHGECAVKTLNIKYTTI